MARPAATAPPPRATAPLERQVAAVRGFNRFYTRQLGVLRRGLLHTPYSLTEARVLYELAQADDTTATALARELGVDGGYLSRLLQGLERRQLVRRRPSPADARRSLLRLTARGRAAFADLDRRSRDEVAALLAPLGEADRRRLLGAMGTIEALVGGRPAGAMPYLLRPHQPGDMGWVVERHGELYAEEYGWNEQFEALVARVVADFLEHFDPRRERCWIAERDGVRVGSVFLVRKTERMAQLRLLLVEPAARGLGIGRRLVSECTRFARQAGYEGITLWTNDVLRAARRLYEGEGYRLVDTEAHSRFGPEAAGETWELRL